ncbi:PI-PLC domain-containing protein [Aeromicrobium massiliense]|uniref:hypothetical protein n=1 Tax=Aeromicrobium massiliense TaxID=1464554 RepID=UPI00057840BA|nr:hypothetical protein [Aeromicrobium massiliense]
MRILSRVLTAVGVLVLLAGLVSVHVDRQVLDADRFAGHVEAVRSDGDVSRLLGVEISDRVIEVDPELVALRPLLESVGDSLVSSPALEPVVRAAVRPLHDALVSGGDGGDQLVLQFADIGALVVAAVTTVAPDVAASLPDDLDVRLAEIGSGSATNRFVEQAHLVGTLSWTLPLLGLALVLAGAWLDGRRGRRLADATGQGLLLAGGGLAGLALTGGFAASVLDPSTLARALTTAAWNSQDTSLWALVAFVAGSGYVVRVAAAIDPDADLRDVGHRVRELALVRRDPQAYLVRGAVLVGVAVLALVRPLQTVRLAVVALAFVALVHGLRQLAHGLTRRRPDAGRVARWVLAHVRVPVAAGLAVALVGLVVVVAVWPREGSIAGWVGGGGGKDPAGCNGRVALCDRPYDQVAQPATHNSMSAGDEPGWFLAEQPTGVMGQLRDGVRVFLIDTWYGRETDREGVVATSGRAREEALRQATEAYGSAIVASALRVRDALGAVPRGPERVYLCHALCELGATELGPLLRDVRGWMDDHPREVVTLFVQDEVTPGDLAALVDDAGLLPMVHTQRTGEPWPTLGEMVDSGRRLVVLQENVGGGDTYPWMLDGFAWVQDTPYGFRSADEMSCAPNRGPADASLLLINHWLSNYSSRVSDAERVNARDVLLPRLLRCRDERGRLPAYVAVDNYDRGDLFGVVDVLNGVD